MRAIVSMLGLGFLGCAQLCDGSFWAPQSYAAVHFGLHRVITVHMVVKRKAALFLMPDYSIKHCCVFSCL